MENDRERARRFGGDAWEGMRDRRAVWQLIGVESLLTAVLAGVVAGVHFGWEVPTAVGVGIITFVVITILFNVPVVGFILGLLLSAFWGLVAFAIGSIWNLFLGIVVGAVVCLAALGAHLGLRN